MITPDQSNAVAEMFAAAKSAMQDTPFKDLLLRLQSRAREKDLIAATEAYYKSRISGKPRNKLPGIGDDVLGNG